MVDSALWAFQAFTITIYTLHQSGRSQASHEAMLRSLHIKLVMCDDKRHNNETIASLDYNSHTGTSAILDQLSICQCLQDSRNMCQIHLLLIIQ